MSDIYNEGHRQMQDRFNTRDQPEPAAGRVGKDGARGWRSLARASQNLTCIKSKN